MWGDMAAHQVRVHGKAQRLGQAAQRVRRQRAVRFADTISVRPKLIDRADAGGDGLAGSDGPVWQQQGGFA